MAQETNEQYGQHEQSGATAAAFFPPPERRGEGPLTATKTSVPANFRSIRTLQASSCFQTFRILLLFQLFSFWISSPSKKNEQSLSEPSIQPRTSLRKRTSTQTFADASNYPREPAGPPGGGVAWASQRARSSRGPSFKPQTPFKPQMP